MSDFFKQTIKPPMVFSQKKKAAIMLALKGRTTIPYYENECNLSMSVEEATSLLPELIYSSWNKIEINPEDKEAIKEHSEEIRLLRALG